MTVFPTTKVFSEALKALLSAKTSYILQKRTLSEFQLAKNFMPWFRNNLFNRRLRLALYHDFCIHKALFKKNIIHLKAKIQKIHFFFYLQRNERLFRNGGGYEISLSNSTYRSYLVQRILTQNVLWIFANFSKKISWTQWRKKLFSKACGIFLLAL